jgi:hypothetical protein
MRGFRSRVVVVLSASALLALANAASAGASPGSASRLSLTGETLNASTDSADFFDCFVPPSTFSFTGTASGRIRVHSSQMAPSATPSPPAETDNWWDR